MVELSASEVAAKKPLVRTHWSEWVLLVLAVISVALLAWESWGTVTEEQRQQIIFADYGICFLFFCNFMWRWRADGWTYGFVGRNWYDVLGMIPVSDPALRSFRLIRVFILLARVSVATDRALGEGFTYRLLTRIKQKVVNSISGVVTVAVLDEVADVLVKGTYTQNISRSLSQNQEQLRNMVREKLREDPQAGRFKRLPFFDSAVENVTDTVLRVTEEVLLDPRTEALVADMLKENIQQIRSAIAEQERQPKRSNE